MSQFGKEIDDILAKDGRDWTKAEQNLIEAEMKSGNRAALKAVREQLREKK